jgi:glycosyltransferase involved in cell wall biosynthesis
MAAHVPVVATDVSGSRELVHNGETGLLVPARDPHALAIALTQLLDNPGGALVMAARAAREVQRYTLEHIAEEYEQLYQRVL